MVAARLPRAEWPDRPMIVVAGDAHTGELAAFDRDSGVDLVDAVTASTALPGMVPTHSINGTHYINGGVRSGENADLASGYANVVVLSPFGGWSQTHRKQASSRACAETRNGARTWQARSRPCASREAASR
jgi:NTE family protein